MDVLGIASLVIGSVAWLSVSQEQQGLKTVHDGGPEFDVVFVHGVVSKRRRSWVPTIRHDKVQWMRNHLRHEPKFRSARLMSYGYQLDETRTSYLSQMLRIETKRLLQELSEQRKGDAQERPVIFISHSLGGLIVKNALADAGEAVAENEHERTLKMIQTCTAGAIFFGTPLHSENRDSFCRSLKRTATEELQLTKDQAMAIEREAEVLNTLVERYKSIEKRLRNYCFWDLKEAIVPEDCAFPNRGRGRWWFGGKDHGLLKRHNDLVKFDGPTDKGYEKLITCMQESLSRYKGRSQGRQSSLQVSPGMSGRFQVALNLFNRQGTDSISRSRSSSSSRSSRASDPEHCHSIYSSVSQSLDQANNFSKSGKHTAAEEKFFEILRHLEKSSEEKSNNVTEVTIDVLDQLAHHYMRKSDYEKAELFFKRTYVALQESTRPLDGTRAAQQLENAAEACLAQGRLGEAARCLERTTIILSKTVTSDRGASIRIDGRLAYTYDQLGRHKEAQKLYTKILEAQEERERQSNHGVEDEEFLKTLQAQAGSYAMDRDYEKAEQLYKYVLERRKFVLTFLRSRSDLMDRIEKDRKDTQSELDSTVSGIASTLRELRSVLDQQGKSELDISTLLADSMRLLDADKSMSTDV